jgi:hypothetical protein
MPPIPTQVIKEAEQAVGCDCNHSQAHEDVIPPRQRNEALERYRRITHRSCLTAVALIAVIVALIITSDFAGSAWKIPMRLYGVSLVVVVLVAAGAGMARLLCEAEIVKDDIRNYGLETQHKIQALKKSSMENQRKIKSLLLRTAPHPQETMTMEDTAYMKALGDTMRRYGND